ncbi:MAG: branched-chain amino acid ABC transporter permease [Candidatus Eremiobacteraeota bacterium]|nr:branched-chain amino acid ABC transporter permease [Candidatus Eremiobacteraeota bacterium]MBV8223292.1 branched-chain amino acid ABC transporter permease [Candidatus Eremiobacteraeota bacterium]MBV8282099.1 branched-chain amino acid ABC transporter permease [Candidatus Eremiobacteraeota bacterium]
MLAQQLVNGLFIGSVYALFALGYTLIFGVLDILNLAHASIFMLGAFTTLVLVLKGVPLLLAILGGALAGGLLGVLLDRVAFWPLRRRQAGPLAPLISSIAVGMIYVGTANGIFGPDVRHFPFDVVRTPTYTIGPVTFTLAQLTIFIASLALMAGLQLLLRRTRLGAAIRAVAENPRAAQLVGIDLESVYAQTFFIASALGAVAGILFALTFNAVSSVMGSAVELKGLAVIVLGGMGSIPGSLLGGLLIGLSEDLSVAYLSSGYRDAIVFAILFLMLIIRPTGLLGKRGLRTA